MDADRRVAVVAERQLGLVTSAQAAEAGVTGDQGRRRVGSGRGRPVRRRVYVINGVPPTRLQVVLGACLAAGPAVWVSHRTAAEVWGLAVPRLPAVELLGVGSSRPRLPGVRGHRSEALHPADVSVQASVPV